MSFKHIFTKAMSVILILSSILILPSCSGTDDDGSENNPPANLPNANTFSDGLAYKAVDGKPNECVITGMGSCTDENIVIPAFIDGKWVVGIEAGAFSQGNAVTAHASDSYVNLTASYDGSFDIGGAIPPSQDTEDEEITIIPGGTNGIDVKSVEIPSTVRYIGQEAFFGCSDLTDINAANLIQLIGQDAFKETAFYNDPKNWDNGILYLNNYLVEVKDEVTGEVVIKDGTKTVADRAFYNCIGLTSVKIPASLTEIGNYAFYGCTSLKSIDIRNKQLRIRERAFENCTSLVSVILGLDEEIYEPVGNEDDGWVKFEINATDPNKTDEVIVHEPSETDSAGRPYIYPTNISGGSIFRGCTSLKTVELYNTVVGNVNSWFYDCTSLESVVLSDNITAIWSYAFHNCPNLKSVDLGDGVQTIMSAAFYKCDALEEIVLPDKVESIEWISWYCPNLKSITFGSGFKKIEWAYPEISVFKYNGTVEMWSQVDVSGLTNTEFANGDGTTSVSMKRGSYTVECINGTVFEKNLMKDVDDEPDGLTFPTEFRLIPNEMLEDIKADVYTNYTAVKIKSTSSGEEREITKITENGIHYVKEIVGEVACELYGAVTDTGITVYKKLDDGKWYLTTATIEDPYYIRYDEITLDTFEISESNVYYINYDAENHPRFELGFLDDRVAYYGRLNDNVEYRTYYIDYGCTEIIELHPDDIVSDVNG